jgi:hypothetical protein
MNEKTQPYAIAGLRKKRDAILTEISDAEAKVQALILQVGHIDAVLRMLQPDILLEVMPKKLRHRRAKRGDHTRPVLDALREAKAPMTVRQCAQAILVAHGKPAQRVHMEAYEAARGVLRVLRKRGVVRPHGMDGAAQTWEMARGS